MEGGTGRLPGRDGTFAGTGRYVCRDGTGRLPGRDVKRNLFKHGKESLINVYISYFPRSVYMEIILPGRFSSRPGKTGSRLKWDNFYHINTPCRFTGRYYADFSNCPAGEFVPRVKLSRVETFSRKPGWKASRPGKRPAPANFPARQTSRLP